MVKLPSKTTPDLWDSLDWSSGALVSANGRTRPLVIHDAPRVPGIYRMTWIGTKDWDLLAKVIDVKASVRVADPRLDFSMRTPPVLLTIGRTTNIHDRIKQHFSTNQNNNRVLSRLRKLLPEPELEVVLELAQTNLFVEWVSIGNWVERCLLEQYGLVTGLPILDLDAEH